MLSTFQTSGLATGARSTTSMANEAENEGGFPGAYSGQGRSWELKTKEAIELLPDKYGFQPKVVLSARAPPTITATAVPFSATRADYVPRQTHVFHERGSRVRRGAVAARGAELLWVLALWAAG